MMQTNRRQGEKNQQKTLRRAESPRRPTSLSRAGKLSLSLSLSGENNEEKRKKERRKESENSEES
jgi:hypothetical protein